MSRHDQSGRSTGRQKVPDRMRIEGQFIARRVAMLDGPAFSALSYSALKMLTRLEIEHAAHGGKENGNLVVTYDDFARAGIRRQSIMDALVELQGLGFVEVTKRGRAAAYNGRSPSTYRLTYLNTKSAGPSDEWQKLDDLAVDRVLASLAAGRRSAPSSQDIDSRCTSAPDPVGASAHPRTAVDGCENAPDIRCTSAPEENSDREAQPTKPSVQGANDFHGRRGAA